jgi:hypothetical protein
MFRTAGITARRSCLKHAKHCAKSPNLFKPTDEREKLSKHPDFAILWWIVVPML